MQLLLLAFHFLPRTHSGVYVLFKDLGSSET